MANFSPKVKVKPLGDRIVVVVDQEMEKTPGGIFLPDTAKETPQWGKVVRCGTGKVQEDGKVRPLTVKEGDKVIFGKYSGTKVQMGEEELLFMREEDVMAVLED